MIEQDDIKQAWDRVARTADGLTIYRHLQRICLGRTPPNAPDSALPRLEGYRSLAGDLMAYMAEGIGDNDRACVTFAVAKPVADANKRTGARRVTLDDAERVGNTDLDKLIASTLAGYPGAAGGGSTNGSGGAT